MHILPRKRHISLDTPTLWPATAVLSFPLIGFVGIAQAVLVELAMKRNGSARLAPFGVLFTLCTSVVLGLAFGKGTAAVTVY